MSIRTAGAASLSWAIMAGAALAQAPSPTTGQFIGEQSTGQYRASKLIGLSVYGPDDQRVGDINEILGDANGVAKAVVIGVGGFLGIGEKNVAVPYSSIQWVNAPARAERAVNTAGAMPTTGTMPTSSGATGGMMSGGIGTPAQTRNPDETAAYNGYPDHALIQATKADLQNAPTFKYYSQAHPTAPASAVTAPLTTAPRP